MLLKVTIYSVVRGYHAFNKKPRNYLLKVKEKNYQEPGSYRLLLLKVTMDSTRNHVVRWYS